MNPEEMETISRTAYTLSEFVKASTNIQLIMIFAALLLFVSVLTVIVITRTLDYLNWKQLKQHIRDEVKECHMQFITHAKDKEYEAIANLILENMQEHLKSLNKKEALSQAKRLMGKEMKRLDYLSK